MRGPKSPTKWLTIIGIAAILLVMTSYHYHHPSSQSRYPPQPRMLQDCPVPAPPPYVPPPPPSQPTESLTSKGPLNGNRVSRPFGAPLQGVRTKLSHPILIFQHFDTPQSLVDLHEASDRSHKRYAEVHGYGYRVDKTDYVGGRSWGGSGSGFGGGRGTRGRGSGSGRDGGSRVGGEIAVIAGRSAADGGDGYVNKIYALLSAVLGVLQGDDKPDWIFYTDADTLIQNPSIPLHLLLPPKSIDPYPHLLLSQDLNGLNTGTILLRPTQEVVVFLSQCLALREEVRESRKGFKGSDQYYFGEVLRRAGVGGVGRGWREIPQDWFNSYDQPKTLISQSTGNRIPLDIGMDSSSDTETSGKSQTQKGANTNVKPKFIPKLQVHFVSETKYLPQWREIESHAEDIYADGRRMSLEVGGHGGGGLEMRSERKGCEDIGREYWARVGLDGEKGGGMRFREE